MSRVTDAAGMVIVFQSERETALEVLRRRRVSETAPGGVAVNRWGLTPAPDDGNRHFSMERETALEGMI
jgi:hypothetical protein